MRFALPAASIAAAVIGVFAPVSFTRAAGLAPSAAECDTCCRQAGATCVVCGSDECVAIPNHYHAMTGCLPEIT
jgi:hypothetical protein